MSRQAMKVAQANRAIARLQSGRHSARSDHRILYWHRMLHRRFGVISDWGKRPWTVRIMNSDRHLILENWKAS